MFTVYEGMSVPLRDGVVSKQGGGYFSHEGRRVSFSADNSCGALNEMSRDSMCLYIPDEDRDVTELVLGPCSSGVWFVTEERVKKAFAWLFGEAVVVPDPGDSARQRIVEG